MPVVNDDGVFETAIEAEAGRLYNLDDRRNDPNPNEPKWENVLPSLKEIGRRGLVGLGVSSLDTPMADEVAPTELSKSAGYDQIRTEKAVPSQSMFDKAIDELLQGSQFFHNIYNAATGKEGTYHTSDIPFSQIEFSKGLLNKDAPIGRTELARQVEDFQARAGDPVDMKIVPEQINQAINVGLGGGPGTLVGVGARGLSKAVGWFKGTDGKYKYEISDENMKLVDKDWKFGEKGKLSDFVEHPELFKAYPELKDMAFEVGKKSDKYIASFNPNTRTLKINPDSIKSGDEGILDVIIHEVQHVIQTKEGFATGSNPTYAAEEALTKLAEKIYSMPAGKQKLELQDLYFELRNNKEDFGSYMYLRSPGEIEANIVSARRKLSDEMRKKFPIEDHKKIVEGEVNTTHGGKYLPEFWYPK